MQPGGLKPLLGAPYAAVQDNSMRNRETKDMKVITAALLLCICVHGPVEGRIKRSQSAKVEFKRDNPCPSSGLPKGPCRGYVIDHVIALACGGPDLPSNMQWQTIAEGKAKDRWERIGCEPHK